MRHIIVGFQRKAWCGLKLPDGSRILTQALTEGEFIDGRGGDPGETICERCADALSAVRGPRNERP